MAALDTNVLVRYLVQDDEQQLLASKQLIQTALQAGEALYIPITVMLELEWVLRSNYGFSKEQINTVLVALLSAAELSIDSEAALEIALSLYKKHSADFADCVHLALAHMAGERPLWTFDKAASKVEWARLLVL